MLKCELCDNVGTLYDVTPEHKVCEHCIDLNGQKNCVQALMRIKRDRIKIGLEN